MRSDSQCLADLALEPSERPNEERCAAVEDSANGIRSAQRARLRVIAIPNRRYPPADEALAAADVVLESLADLSRQVIAGEDGAAGPPSSSPLRA